MVVGWRIIWRSHSSSQRALQTSEMSTEEAAVRSICFSSKTKSHQSKLTFCQSNPQLGFWLTARTRARLFVGSMFTSKSIFALVVVIFASTHLCLNRSSAAESPLLGGEEVPNASILAASKLPVLHHPQTEQQQQLNSEKSDHNFYLPTPEKANLSLEEAKAVLPLSRRKRSTSALKRPPVCLHLFTSLISPPNHHKQCSVIQKAKKTPNTAQSLSSSPAASVARPPPTATSKVPKYNATPEDCDLPKDTSLLKEGAGNDPEIIHPPQSQQGTSVYFLFLVFILNLNFFCYR